MACLRELRAFMVLATTALGLWLPASLAAPSPRPQSSQTPAKTLQKKLPPNVYIQQQKVAVPQPAVTLTLKASTENPAVNEVVRFELTWNREVWNPKYQIDWGGGEPRYEEVTGTRVDHAFAAMGDFTVKVTGKTLLNDRVTSIPSNEVTIHVRPAPPHALPTPTLRANAVSVRLGEPITFRADIDESAGPVQFDFFFGDDNHQIPDTNEFVYIYPRPGSFRPFVVAVRASEGITATSGAIDVNVTAPDLAVTLETKEPTAGEPLTVQASLDPPHENFHYVFTWDDSPIPTPGDASGRDSHSYASAGKYTVRVRAWMDGADNYPSTGERSIVVGPAASPPARPERNETSPPVQPDNGNRREWPIKKIVIAVIAVAGAAVVWKWLRRRPQAIHARPRFIAHPGGSSQSISFAGKQVSHVSLTLNPGMDPAEHRITFL